MALFGWIAFLPEALYVCQQSLNATIIDTNTAATATAFTTNNNSHFTDKKKMSAEMSTVGWVGFFWVFFRGEGAG